MTIKVIICGKIREREFRTYLDDLKTRLTPYAKIEEITLADQKDIFRHTEKAGKIHILDVAGKSIDSAGFSRLIDTDRACFVIGPHEGFSPPVMERLKLSGNIISLSQLTFPHRLCAVILMEQIYRGFCILHGLPYAK